LGPVRAHARGRARQVRGVEVIHALDEAIRVIEAYAPPPAPAVPVAMRAGTGHAITCAPCGILYHRYAGGDDGLVSDAQIATPTSQNQRSIEDGLLAIGPMLAALPHDVATRRAEHAIPNHDPCISRSTHFLTLAFERNETRSGDPDGSAGGAGGSAPRGIERRT
jgi:coenzyme F420-reducing hydrogenase alpha subunit